MVGMMLVVLAAALVLVLVLVLVGADADADAGGGLKKDVLSERDGHFERDEVQRLGLTLDCYLN